MESNSTCYNFQLARGTKSKTISFVNKLSSLSTNLSFSLITIAVTASLALQTRLFRDSTSTFPRNRSRRVNKRNVPGYGLMLQPTGYFVPGLRLYCVMIRVRRSKTKALQCKGWIEDTGSTHPVPSAKTSHCVFSPPFCCSMILAA